MEIALQIILVLCLITGFTVCGAAALGYGIGRLAIRSIAGRGQ
jgi:hypothetical protein